MIDEKVCKQRLEKILEKFYYLKSIDKEYKVFGSTSHKYEFRKPLKEGIISDFEKKYNVKIPYEYKLFLLEVGNGGAGPFYGIEPFENCLFSNLDYLNENYLLNPSIPFPYTDEWNIEFDNDYSDENEELIEEFENEYFDNKHITGLIRICNFGCGHYINLVVNGEEYSHIWSDDRSSDYGIYPFNYYSKNKKERLSFFDFYEQWIDQSLNPSVSLNDKTD